MIELYFFPSPNGLKIAIMLEECGLPYEVKPVNIGRGEQFHPDYLAINPNNKIPAIVDRDTGIPVFESGAILVYLAEKAGRFLPAAPGDRMQCLSWLFWQVGGLGPMAGQAHHFRAFASEQVPYGIKRYTDECNRLYGVMDRQLATHEYLAGEYSIADIACWPWIVPHERQGQELGDFPHLERWFESVRARPAVQRGFNLGHEKMMDREGYRFLYGQTADMVDEQTRQQTEQDTGRDS
ncbi:MAG: glutathione S-transferase N-terminal domain-containing protein [Chromatiales bacterium]|nr:MAG: glutathione S-transferase N-terminal domain-containing protein [Chromatiales bacterium]